MKIALVHDWLTGIRGGERVLQHLARRFPSADLYTLLHERGSVPEEIERLRIHTSPIDRVPGRATHYRKLLPLFPWAIRAFDLAGYDLVISTSHAVAKSVRTPPHVPHVSYCFTPMRYVWDQRDAYLGRGLRRQLAAPLVHGLRRFDARTSHPDSVTRFVAISSEVAARIERHYGRRARVVPPPVDVSWIGPATNPPRDAPYLLVGGFVPYKREALAIDAFRGSDRRLVIAGDGPLRRRLERDAPPNVRFLGRVSDARLAALYRECRALVYPQREDFGLVAVEAQAAGRPVIAYGRGGVLDTVVPLAERAASRTGACVVEATGVFFDESSPDALRIALERFERSEERFDPRAIRRWATGFSPARFDAALDEEIERARRAVRPRSGPAAEARP